MTDSSRTYVGVAAPAIHLNALDKVNRPSQDPYFDEAWEDMAQQLGGALEQTLFTHAALILKADAIVARKIVPAMDFLLEHGFVPVAFSPFVFTRNMVRALWQDQPFLAKRDVAILVDLFLPSTASLFVLVRKSCPDGDAVGDLRNFKGPTKVGSRLPWHLRERLQAPYALLNFVHSADHISDFVREFGIFFSHWDRVRILRTTLRGLNMAPEINEFARRLYAVHPEHDLRVESSLQRIMHSNAATDISHSSTHRKIRSCCADLLSGESQDWRRLLALLQDGAVETNLWDQVTVGIGTLDRLD